MYRLKQQHRRTKAVLGNRHIWCWGSAVCIVVGLASCSVPKLKENPRIATLTTQLDKIDTVRLEEHSRTQPVTVAEATTELIEEITDPNETVAAVELTLEEVRAAALANNLDLKVELVDPAIAQQTLDAERAKFEAVLGASMRHRRASDTDSSSRRNSYHVGVDQPLVTGGVLSVGLPFGDSHTSNADWLSDAAVSVSYIQSLLRGAGTNINTHSIRIAGYQKHGVDAYTKLTAIGILAQADTTYWRLYASQRDLEVRREQYKLAQDQLHHAQRKVASGSAAKIEIVRAEAGLASRFEAVINSETAVQSRERDLRRIMNRDDMPLNSLVHIIPMSEPHPLGLDLDAEELANQAIGNRMDMVAQELYLAAEELEIELAHNATLPDLALDYTYNGAVQSSHIGRALGNLGHASYDDHSIGLSALIPIGNQAAKARVQRARLQQLQGRIDRDRLAQSIRQQVYEAVNDLHRNWRRILAAEQGVEAAYRDYKVEQSQFQLGLRTSTAVLYSAAGLANAQLSKIYAFAEYEIAQVNLARATGTLLGYGQIQLDSVNLDDN
ncbi:MAG: TolC family protein [Phycisphaerae bacterium]|nr:TolC family protein [Phycisphaerae bacterium]